MFCVGLLLPASCVRRLEAGLKERTDPGSVEAAVAQAACSCAAGDGPMSAAVAAYAFTLVDEAMAAAVLAGARACNADDAEVAAAASRRPVDGMGDFRPSGLGRGLQEPCRNASPVTFC